ncbi:hypothetical protein E2C01_039425 [Portunus trituberculatus]|uniref:Uncharacterized protein n=1 Tax=Portunus trituberculatus TaxID=210409 RepID=A0A5B7FKQ9_PORTR|nr:hypothetical protein [Portunus trituberculatus]
MLAALMSAQTADFPRLVAGGGKGRRREHCDKMEVRDLDVGDLLGLLESPQEEVAQEVRLLLKETFSTVRESWLITGLLEYFYVSNR